MQAPLRSSFSSNETIVVALLFRRGFLLRVVFLGFVLRYASSLIRMQDILDSYDIRTGATTTGLQRNTVVLREISKQDEQSKPNPVSRIKTVEMTLWANPSEAYVIDSTDLWEIVDGELPEWMKDYFRWHKEQTANDRVSATSTLPNDRKYLYVTCLKEYNKCGGTADRLLSLPFFVKVAATTNRVLLIQWTKPAALEEFLLPPVSGIDWRVPMGMEAALRAVGQKAGTQDTIFELAVQESIAVVQVKFQSHDHGSIYYDSARESYSEPDFKTVFHSVWKIFFTPAPALASVIKAALNDASLMPGEYTAAHLRALYATNKRDGQLVKGWTVNSIQCAVTLQQRTHQPLPVFFASDSGNALREAAIYGKASGVRVVTRSITENSENALHIDKTKDWKQRPVSDFYDVFVDLYLMGLSKCVTFGMGGYGQLASYMTPNANCSIVHMTATSVERCTLPPEVVRKQRAGDFTTIKAKVFAEGSSITPIFLPPVPLEARNQHGNLSVGQSIVESHFPDLSGRRPEKLWEESRKLPRWMKDYFAWHREQRKLITDDNWREFKYIVMICLRKSKKCGGTADRLRPLPFMVRVAAETKRILLIKWERPAPLEAFLVPPAAGLDWQTPDWMEPALRTDGDQAVTVQTLVALAARDETIVKSRVQAHDHGSQYYDSQGERMGEGAAAFRQHYHDCWYSLFTPVPAIAAKVEDELERMNILPGEFAFAHLRAAYGIEEMGLRDPVLVQNWTKNALNCVSSLRPGGPFLFSSDSSYAKEIAMQYGRERNVTVVARRDSNKEPLHLHLAPNWETRNASEYYPLFIDLYLMSMGRCYSFNMGGFAKLASLISVHDVACNVRHWTAGVNKKSANKDGCTWTDPKPANHEPVLTKKLTRPLFLPPM